ncbi:MAG TPA: thioredoxin family protein [Candidatus Polarisedimenticolia bacterium]|nr:thioredoxin family protein [Candidatus Polarisedimenticolia bacterium]
MTIDRARFDKGLTYDAYKEQMTRNRDRLEENEQRVDLSKEDLAAFRALPRPVKVVVLAEDWCGDVIANLPVLGRLSKESGKLDVRIFLRDQNDDIMQRYLNKGQFKSIPVFVFFDDAFRELGHWIERPASVTEVRAKRRKDIFAAHPEFGSPDAPVDQLAEDVRVRLQAELAKMRDDTAKFANAEVVRELREIATRIAA